MRLVAKTDFTFQGKDIRIGTIFDAPEQQAQDLINQDLAHRFHLEDPSTLNNPPVAEPPEAQPPAVVSLSPDVAPASGDGDTGSVTVTITTPGIWIVEADPAAAWLTYTPTTPQSTDGTVDWTAEANTDVAPRQAILHVNGEAFTLNQDVAGAGSTSTHHNKRHSKG